MINEYELEIEEVSGYCVYNYKVGDKFKFNGLATLNNFCGGAYATAYPVISVLEFGGKFTSEDNHYCKNKLACPDNGNIIFKITKVQKHNT